MAPQKNAAILVLVLVAGMIAPMFPVAAVRAQSNGVLNTVTPVYSQPHIVNITNVSVSYSNPSHPSSSNLTYVMDWVPPANKSVTVVGVRVYWNNWGCGPGTEDEGVPPWYNDTITCIISPGADSVQVSAPDNTPVHAGNVTLEFNIDTVVGPKTVDIPWSGGFVKPQVSCYIENTAEWQTISFNGTTINPSVNDTVMPWTCLQETQVIWTYPSHTILPLYDHSHIVTVTSITWRYIPNDEPQDVWFTLNFTVPSPYHLSQCSSPNTAPADPPGCQPPVGSPLYYEPTPFNGSTTLPGPAVYSNATGVWSQHDIVSVTFDFNPLYSAGACSETQTFSYTNDSGVITINPTPVVTQSDVLWGCNPPSPMLTILPSTPSDTVITATFIQPNGTPDRISGTPSTISSLLYEGPPGQNNSFRIFSDSTVTVTFPPKLGPLPILTPQTAAVVADQNVTIGATYGTANASYGIPWWMILIVALVITGASMFILRREHKKHMYMIDFFRHTDSEGDQR